MRATILAFSLSLTASICTGDTIVLKDGRQLQGKVIARSRGKIAFKTDAGKLVMFKNDEVARVVKGDKEAPPRSAARREDKPDVTPRRGEREIASPSAEQHDLLSNGSFEIDRNRDGVPDGWRFKNRAEWVSGDGADGEHFLRLFLDGRKKSEAVCDRSIAVEPSSAYRVSLQMRTEKEAHRLHCVLKFNASGGKGSVALPTPRKWTRQDLYFVTGPGDRQLKRITFTQTSTRTPGNGHWDIDAVTLARVGPAAAGRIGLADEFDDSEAWTAHGDMAIRSEDGRLVVTGERGSVAVKDYGVLDLTKYHYIVAKLDDRHGKGYFRLHWQRANPEGRFLLSNFLYRFGSAKGISALDINTLRPWDGLGVHPVRLSVAHHGGARFDWLRFVSDLTPEEHEGLVRVPPQLKRRGGQRRHGLAELAKRRGAKPPLAANSEGWRPAETLAYRDTLTQTTVWRVTDSPDMDKRVNETWSRDGRYLLLYSFRPYPHGGRQGWWLTDTQSKRRRALPKGMWYWGPGDRPLLYGTWPVDEGLAVYSFDPGSLVQERLACLDVGGPRVAYGLSFARNGAEMVLSSWKTPLIFVLDLQTSTAKQIRVQERGTRIIGFKGVWIRRDGTMGVAPFFDTDAGRHGLAHEVWIVDRDGSFLRPAPRAFGGHGCRSEDGSTQFYLANGWLKSNDAQDPTLAKERTLTWYGASDGHSCWAGDGWVLASLSNQGPWEHQIVRVSTDGRGFLHSICEPDSLHIRGAYEAWPRVNASPDGTKALYNSDMLANNDVYVAVVHPPDPPRDLVAQPAGGQVRLTWQTPVNCRELKGYYVYRSRVSGTDAQALNADVLTGNSFADHDVENGTTYYYCVTAVEHFGLESLPSNEVCVTPPDDTSWRGPTRLFVEAERGDIQAPLRPWIDGTASGNMCVKVLRHYKEDPRGTLDLLLALPRKSRYALWGRVRGTPGEVLDVALREANLGQFRCPEGAANAWIWAPLAEPDGTRPKLPLHEQQYRLRFQADRDDVALDQILLTDDPGYTPEGRGGIDRRPPARVEGLEVASADTTTVKLHWHANTDTDVARYDVFCSGTAEIEPSNACLIGSTQEPSFVDWGLRPGTEYHYVVTAVDRHDNRSEPSEPISARTVDRETTRIDIELESASIGSPVVKRDDATASGEACLAVPAGAKTEDLTAHSLKVSFELARPSRYDIWLRCVGIRTDSVRWMGDDKFKGSGVLKLDGRYYLIWWCRSFVRPENAAKGRIAWTWFKLTYSGSGDPFRLVAGTHSLALAKVVAHDGELRLDKLILTDDAGFVPEGRGARPESQGRAPREGKPDRAEPAKTSTLAPVPTKPLSLPMEFAHGYFFRSRDVYANLARHLPTVAEYTNTAVVSRSEAVPAFAKQNLRVLFSLGRRARSGIRQFEGTLGPVIRAHRDHILAIYLVDEPYAGGMSRSQLASLVDECKRVFPDVPVFVNFLLGPKAKLTDHQDPIPDSIDIVGFDHYVQGTPAEVKRQTILNIRLMKRLGKGRPVLICARAFVGWGWTAPPSREETAAYVEAASEGGASGLLWYFYGRGSKGKVQGASSFPEVISAHRELAAKLGVR